MPVSSMIVTLAHEDAACTVALRQLRAHPAIELGEGDDHRFPIVVDTPDADADREVWAWLNDLEGVAFVDLVSVYFDDGDDDDPSRDPHITSPPGCHVG